MATMLPMDVWLRVTDLTPDRDRRALLGVSRALREAVLPSLFNAIEIRFGLWESLRTRCLDPEVDLEELSRTTAQRDQEIMSHIITNSAFARVVRELRVLSYTFREDLGDQQIEVLLATIRAVRHLQRFQWMGNFPQLPLAVAQTLSKHCPNLQELRIPATHVADIVPESLTLSNLTSLTIVCQLDVDNIRGYVPEHIASSQRELQKLINSNMRLTHLTIYSELLEDISPSVIAGLQELELWGPHDEHVGILRHVLPCTSNLKMLGIVEIKHQFENIMLLLLENARAFPNLSGFKVMSLETVDAAPCMNPLSDFLRMQPHLEWLDIDMPGVTSTSALTVLETVSHLQHLRVLGFDLRSITDEEDVAILARYLPRSLTTLHLQISWENIPFSSEELVDLLCSLIGMRGLTFFHVESQYTTNYEVVEELVDQLEKLKVIGFGRDFWNIKRTTANPLSDQWSVKDVALRSIVSLGETGEWLLRFHNLLGDTL